MLSIERIRWLLSESNLKKVATITKIPYVTVWKIINKEDSKPSYENVKKLSEYLENKIAKNP